MGLEEKWLPRLLGKQILSEVDETSDWDSIVSEEEYLESDNNVQVHLYPVTAQKEIFIAQSEAYYYSEQLKNVSSEFLETIKTQSETIDSMEFRQRSETMEYRNSLQQFYANAQSEANRLADFKSYRSELKHSNEMENSLAQSLENSETSEKMSSLSLCIESQSEQLIDLSEERQRFISQSEEDSCFYESERMIFDAELTSTRQELNQIFDEQLFLSESLSTKEKTLEQEFQSQSEMFSEEISEYVSMQNSESEERGILQNEVDSLKLKLAEKDSNFHSLSDYQSSQSNEVSEYAKKIDSEREQRGLLQSEMDSLELKLIERDSSFYSLSDYQLSQSNEDSEYIETIDSLKFYYSETLEDLKASQSNKVIEKESKQDFESFTSNYIQMFETELSKINSEIIQVSEEIHRCKNTQV